MDGKGHWAWACAAIALLGAAVAACSGDSAGDTTSGTSGPTTTSITAASSTTSSYASTTGAGGSGGDDGEGGAGGSGSPPYDGWCAGMHEDPAGPAVHWFDDVTEATGLIIAGVDPLDTALGNGVAVADLDGDGLLDVVVTTGLTGPTRVFKNLGGLTFSDVTSTFAPSPLQQGLAVALRDLDNDGDPDLVVTAFGATGVYENVEGDHFVDRSVDANLFGSGPMRGTLIGDVDRDGLVDAYLFANTNRLFRNLGDFHFQDVTAAYKLGFSAEWPTWSGSIFDYDGDGVTDVYVQLDTNVKDYGFGDPVPDMQGDYLFHGGSAGGTPTFTNLAISAGVGAPRSSMGAVVADFNGDGRLDLYTSNIGKNPLLLSQGDGTFVESADDLGIGCTRRVNASCPADSTNESCVLHSWGAGLFDVDHDGFDDLVVVNGTTFAVQAEQPARLFRGRPDGTFEPVEGNINCLHGRSMVPADLDDDGDLDVIATTVGAPVHVFRNNAAAGQGWVRVRLDDPSGFNREGIGATVTASFASGRTVVRGVGVSGVVLSTAPAEAHFAAGADTIEAIDVAWPSGVTRHVEPVELGQVLVVSP